MVKRRWELFFYVIIHVLGLGCGGSGIDLNEETRGEATGELEPFEEDSDTTEETEPAAVEDFSAVLANATFCPTPDNSFLAGGDDCIVFAGDEPPFQVTWTAVYQNCEAEVSGERVTITCDTLGSIAPTLTLDENGALLTQEIYFADIESMRLFSYRRQ